MIDTSAIRRRYEAVAPHLDERGLRLFAASEARAAGRGGIAAVSQTTGIARSTIGRGLRDLDSAASAWPSGRVRRSGGGRKAAVVEQPGLLEALTELIASAIRGDPQAALLWVSRSQRHLAGQLAVRGYRVDHTVVGRLLKDMGFSLQANAKTREGSQHPDRNAQFEHINACVGRFRRAGQPAISVDTKKKELIGDFKNAGRELRPKGQPEEVRVHDFMIAANGKAVPYGVYDIAANEGWVSVGIDHDTAAFAVESIRRWWHRMGRKRYPRAKRLLITADCGGSNGARLRLWKVELQKLADRDRPGHLRRPSPARHQQVEPHRASHVLLHHPELARQAAADLQGDRPAHRRNDHEQSVSRSPAPSTPANIQRVAKSQKHSSTPSRSDTTPSIRTGTTPSFQSEPLE